MLSAERRIDFHLVLQGPTDPKHLTVDWPDWALRDNKILWLELKLAAPHTILEVTRCNEL